MKKPLLVLLLACIIGSSHPAFAAGITLISPLGGETLNQESIGRSFCMGPCYDIRWKVDDGVAAGPVAIRLSQNGEDWPDNLIIAPAVDTDPGTQKGLYSWVVYANDVPTGNYYLKISSVASPAINVVSGSTFTVAGPVPPQIPQPLFITGYVNESQDRNAVSPLDREVCIWEGADFHWAYFRAKVKNIGGQYKYYCDVRQTPWWENNQLKVNYGIKSWEDEVNDPQYGAGPLGEHTVNYNAGDGSEILSPLTMEQGAGPVDEEATDIALTIDRYGNNDIMISDPDQDELDLDQVYVLVGDGSGQYNNAYDLYEAADDTHYGKWLYLGNAAHVAKADLSIDAVNAGNGTLTIQNQIGGLSDYGEIYFKAVKPDFNGDIEAVFPTIKAVGKLDIAIYQGLNLVSMPFAKEPKTLDNVLGIDQLSENDSYYMMLSASGADFFRAYLKLNDGWYDASNNQKIADNISDYPLYQELVDPKYGYFIEAQAEKTLTVFGNVINTDVDVPIAANGFTILGMYYPRSAGLETSNLINNGDAANSAGLNDNFYYKMPGTDGDYLRAYVNDALVWVDASNDKTITNPDYNADLKTLKLPNAYFFYNEGDAFNWKRTK